MLANFPGSIGSEARECVIHDPRKSGDARFPKLVSWAGEKLIMGIAAGCGYDYISERNGMVRQKMLDLFAKSRTTGL